VSPIYRFDGTLALTPDEAKRIQERLDDAVCRVLGEHPDDPNVAKRVRLLEQEDDER
jgi:hypothetical protein